MTTRMPTPISPVANSSPAIEHERVARRAYENWCRRGCPQGTEKQDWYEAEAELRREQARGTAGPPRR
jgi:hypothetical protein